MSAYETDFAYKSISCVALSLEPEMYCIQHDLCAQNHFQAPNSKQKDKE